MIVKKSFNDIFRAPGFSVLSVVFDVLFFFLFGFITGPVRVRLAELATIIASSIPSVVEKLDFVTVSKVFFSPDIKPFLFRLLSFVFLFYFLVFVVFVVCQGLAWWFAFKIVKPKSFLRFFWSFFRISLFWGVILAVLHFVSVFVDLRFEVLKKFNPSSVNFLGYFIFALIVISAVLVFFSYLKLRLFAFFKIPFKKSFNVLFVSFIIIVLIKLLPKLVAKINPTVALVVSFLLTFPGFLFIRVYSINLVKLKKVE
ncbi:hypothetical protein DRJ22_02575 [Candidatus Woesearchaeota archaeon]|nr:MAG: hypothetical protein B6U93_00030 [Candidatus Woesearchaeota archaeon ex4484_78]RLE46183.1 MAG: hypothetical protein DRJ22_02575 [Candidatus Woesearchaeota archaeon]